MTIIANDEIYTEAVAAMITPDEYSNEVTADRVRYVLCQYFGIIPASVASGLDEDDRKNAVVIGGIADLKLIGTGDRTHRNS